jgi:hypothetical protein
VARQGRSGTPMGNPLAAFWERLTPLQRGLTIAAIVAAFAVPHLDKVVEPFARGFALSSQIVEGERELSALDAEHTALAARMEQLRTPDGLRLEIRETTGQVADGEYPLHVILPPPSADNVAKEPVPFMRAQGLDNDSLALAIHDYMAAATEVFLKWAGVGRPKKTAGR